MKRKRRQAIQGILYVLPSFVLLLCFSLIPICMSIYYSFMDYNVMTQPKFVGLSNYIKMFSDSYFGVSMKNTLIYVILTVPFQVVLPLVFAAFLAQKLADARLGGLLRSLIFIPVIASSVTVGCIWKIIFAADNGILNRILEVFNIAPINWLGTKEFALLSICIVAIWRDVGYFLVIYYAGIRNISRDYYEAARVDGATRFQQFTKITLPLLKPITYLVVTLGLIWGFQAFDLPYLMTGGGPGYSSVTFVMGIYNTAFKQYRMGYACANAVVLLILIVGVNLLEDVFFKEKKEAR